MSLTEEEIAIMSKLLVHPVISKMPPNAVLAIIDFVSEEVFDKHSEWCRWLYCNEFEDDPREFEEPQCAQPSNQYRYQKRSLVA